ncbi:MAG: phosphoribosylformylglycinamidine synthase I [Deltaproteobacteria bacterium CG11_big_fil_rev_8_21_14_0_20_47_16]|nr:MAG: phosphoribosylformylglycinamidine synthase I [Deltaproteobacteria bacterium CG11_big_fil_rev_8_21_14_0_20_47_16]
MKVGVITFPASNCDQDCVSAVKRMGASVVSLWHRDASVQDVDAVIIPGGFSYGDYLRCGAMAAHSPIMAAVKQFAAKGGRVLGICNGFQILTESGLLPGVLMRNAHLKFVCRTVAVKIVNTQTAVTSRYKSGQILQMPVAHMEGNYFADATTLATLKKNNQIVFQYADGQNPNGAIDNIAGICNEARNVVGLMPHPERVCDPLLGGTDGVELFKALLQ